MPQLDFFTLLFQFKSFFVIFLLFYFSFLFFFIPRLHFIISIRRFQVLNLLRYFNSLKLIIYFCFSLQSSFLKSKLVFFNITFYSYFIKYLTESKYSISNILFSDISY